MANCSIPNSILANGRISTGWLRRLRRPSKQASSEVSLAGDFASRVEKRRQAAALQNALRAREIRRWMVEACSRFIGVGRWAFSAIWRVKGAWWPSRSSKPSLSRKWRGRFDSYPLRLNCGLAIGDCGLQSVTMTTQELKNRTFEFGVRVITSVEALPKNETAKILGRRLLRAGTSVGANYRAAARARSQADFISKLGVVEEECDESAYWMAQSAVRNGKGGEPQCPVSAFAN